MAYLQTNLHPVQLCALEELGSLQSLEQALLLQVLGVSVMQPVQHIHLQQLLVTHTHLHWVVGRAVLIEPVVDQRHIHRSPSASRPVITSGLMIVYSIEFMVQSVEFMSMVTRVVQVTCSSQPVNPSHPAASPILTRLYPSIVKIKGRLSG